MDAELLEKLAACCAGKSEDEIAEMVQASRHGAKVRDPMAIARYLAKLAQANAG
jgi:hypothetical protein